MTVLLVSLWVTFCLPVFLLFLHSNLGSPQPLQHCPPSPSSISHPATQLPAPLSPDSTPPFTFYPSFHQHLLSTHSLSLHLCLLFLLSSWGLRCESCNFTCYHSTCQPLILFNLSPVWMSTFGSCHKHLLINTAFFTMGLLLFFSSVPCQWEWGHWMFFTWLTPIYKKLV